MCDRNDAESAEVSDSEPKAGSFAAASGATARREEFDLRRGESATETVRSNSQSKICNFDGCVCMRVHFCMMPTNLF